MAAGCACGRYSCAASSLHSVASSALPAASASAARSSISPARLCIESACDCTTYLLVTGNRRDAAMMSATGVPAVGKHARKP